MGGFFLPIDLVDTIHLFSDLVQNKVSVAE